MKKLLLLGGSRYLLPAIEAAHTLEEEIHVITCDYLPNNIAHKYSDEYHNVNIVDKEAVLKKAQELKVDGVLSFATDPGVVSAAYAAERLGLPSAAPYESIKILQNKDLFRNFMKENGFNVPWHKMFRDKMSAINGITEDDLPVVVKPVDSAGSKGVTKVERMEEIEVAVEKAFRNSIAQRCIVEKFIPLKYHQSGSDSFVKEGKLVFTSFDKQYYDLKAANPFTPAAMCYPSDIPEEKLNEIRRELQRLVNILRIGTTIINVECRVGMDDKAYIMEVSTRAGGNRVPEIVKYATGVDLIKNDVKHALGMPIEDFKSFSKEKCYARVIVHSYKNGIFEGIQIAGEVEKKYLIEKDIWYSVGTEVGAFTGANQSLGLLFLKFPSQEIAEKYLTDIEGWLIVSVR